MHPRRCRRWTSPRIWRNRRTAQSRGWSLPAAHAVCIPSAWSRSSERCLETRNYKKDKNICHHIYTSSRCSKTGGLKRRFKGAVCNMWLKWVLQSQFKILERVVSHAPSSIGSTFTWVARLRTQNRYESHWQWKATSFYTMSWWVDLSAF